MCTKNYNFNQLTTDIKVWGKNLGFSVIGITDSNLASAQKNLTTWTQKNHHGDMKYLSKAYIPQAKTIISCARNYYIKQQNNYIAK